MKIQASVLLLALASVVSAEFHLRSSQFNPFQELELEQYSCTIEGAGGQDQCDAATDESGKKCVWCSVGSFGACLSADQAKIIEDKIPGLTCDDDDNDDAKADDDAKTDDAATDDNTPPDDDSNYWKCLKDGSESEDACESAGCTWCTSKAGFGICLDDAAAKMASDSAWLDCKTTFETLELMDLKEIQAKKLEEAEEEAQMPGDPACIMATLQQDESVCTSTVDSAGNPCSWCNIDNINVCLDDTLATMAKQYGGSCGDDVVAVEDPADTSCIVATLQQDETACTDTMDADGRACEWCMVAQAQVCLNADQAQLAEQFGGSCGDSSAMEEEPELEDPTDTTCLMATLQQDESACTSTSDAEGNPCSWCAISNFDLCLNADQATLAEQFGGACDENRVEEEEEDVEDPADTSCIVATLQQDETACTDTMDADGRSCEWCMVAQAQVCLNADQAQLAEQFGGSCGDSAHIAME